MKPDYQLALLASNALNYHILLSMHVHCPVSIYNYHVNVVYKNLKNFYIKIIKERICLFSIIIRRLILLIKDNEIHLYLQSTFSVLTVKSSSTVFHMHGR